MLDRDGRRGSDDLVGAARLIIDQRCGEALTIKQAAASIGTSSRTLQRSLARANGDFTTMLYEARRRRAARLVAAEHPIGYVARACGYKSFSHFSHHVFPAWFGMTPLQFRHAFALYMLESSRTAAKPPWSQRQHEQGDDALQVARLRENLDNCGELPLLLAPIPPHARMRFLQVAAELRETGPTGACGAR